jgi:hypothetical protein
LVHTAPEMTLPMAPPKLKMARYRAVTTATSDQARVSVFPSNMRGERGVLTLVPGSSLDRSDGWVREASGANTEKD